MKKHTRSNRPAPANPSGAIRPIAAEDLRGVTGGTDSASGQAQGKRQHEPL